MIQARTRLVALLGDPVSHSLSPSFQNAAIRAAGLDAVYLALRATDATVDGLILGLAAAGGAGNVTIPHKTRVVAALDEPSEAVERTGACNTFWSEGGRLYGDNTDVHGFDAAARELVGSPAGARVLVVGAGGAALAAVVALLDARADRVDVLNRSSARAEALRDRLDPSGRRVALIGEEQLPREGYDLLVNATPLGLRADDPVPVDPHRPARVGAVLDMTYGKAPSRLVELAGRAGIAATDGREMLVRQGAASFRRWFGEAPDLEVMRSALI